MKLTKAQIAALQAVKDEKVTRIYDGKGNTLHSAAGNSPQVLWALDRMKLMQDGRDNGGVLVTRCTQILTKAGEDALHTANWG